MGGGILVISNNRSHALSWIECKETARDHKSGREQTQRFVHITSLPGELGADFPAISDAGRLHWKIENEGFNVQKRQGYALQHKFSRTSYRALKNYYQTLQIAHLFHQLIEHEQSMSCLLSGDGKLTIKHVLEKIRAIFCYLSLDQEELDQYNHLRF